MIDALLALFKTPSPQKPQQELDLAVAVLLTEIIKADHLLDEREEAALRRVLTQLFKLDEASCQSLMARAKDKSAAANDLFTFTEAINANWQAEDKYRLLQGLWQVAFSDNNLDKYEEYNIRRISDLLYVPHSEFIRAKLSVKPKDA